MLLKFLIRNSILICTSENTHMNTSVEDVRHLLQPLERLQGPSEDAATAQATLDGVDRDGLSPFNLEKR